MCTEGYINSKKNLKAIIKCENTPTDLHRTHLTRKAEKKPTTYKKEWEIQLFCGKNGKSRSLESTYRFGKSASKVFWALPRMGILRLKRRSFYKAHADFKKHFDPSYTATYYNDRPTIKKTNESPSQLVLADRYRGYSGFSGFGDHGGSPYFYPLYIPGDNCNYGGGDGGGGCGGLCDGGGGDECAVVMVFKEYNYMII